MFLYLSEIEREIAFSKCCAVPENPGLHCPSWGKVRSSSGAWKSGEFVCLSKWFARLTLSTVKAHLISHPFTSFFLSIFEHSKLKSVDNLSQKPCDYRQLFEVFEVQDNQPPQKSSFLIKHFFSPDSKQVLKSQSVYH